MLHQKYNKNTWHRRMRTPRTSLIYGNWKTIGINDPTGSNFLIIVFPPDVKPAAGNFLPYRHKGIDEIQHWCRRLRTHLQSSGSVQCSGDGRWWSQGFLQTIPVLPHQTGEKTIILWSPIRAWMMKQEWIFPKVLTQTLKYHSCSSVEA